MTEHDWIETETDPTGRRLDYICEDCGRTKTIIRIPVVSLVAFIMYAILLLVTIP